VEVVNVEARREVAVMTRTSDYVLCDPRTPTRYTNGFLIKAGVNFVMSSTQRFIDVMMSEWVGKKHRG